MGTVVVGIIVAGVVALAVRSMVRDKKNGKSIQCGGSSWISSCRRTAPAARKFITKLPDKIQRLDLQRFTVW